MDRDELRENTKASAHRCVRAALALPENALGRHLRGQLIRCATSGAASYRAACVTPSRAACVAKLSIVVDEIDEPCFWMEFFLEEKLLAKLKIAALPTEGGELTAIFVATRRTTRKNPMPNTE
jgi:four helix bundle protein